MTTRVEVFRAMAHPVRLQLLSLLTGAPMSAAEAAREIGTSQANASYHLRQLHRVGSLEVPAEPTDPRAGHLHRRREGCLSLR